MSWNSLKVYENGFSQFVVWERNWSAQSPDLSHIQHLWDYMKRGLWAAHPILGEWEQIPASRLEILVQSLPEEWKLVCG